MSALSLIAIIFIETLVIVFGGAISFSLAKEYGRRRRFFLLASAFVFLFCSFAIGALFLAQILEVYGRHFMAVRLSRTFDEFFALAGISLLFAASDMIGSRLKWLFFSASAVIGAGALYVGARIPDKVGFIGGLLFAGPQFDRMLPLATPGMISALLFAASSIIALSARKRSRPTKSQSYLLVGSSIVLVSVAISLFDWHLGSSLTAAIDFVALPAFFLCMFFGTVSYQHPDRQVEENPVVVVTRSFTLKAVLVMLSVFWMLALILTSVSTSYFGKALLESNLSSVRRQLNFFSRSYALFSERALAEAARIASESASRGTLAGDHTAASMMATATPDKSELRILRLLDADGRIVFSSFSPEERGLMTSAPALIANALAGRRAAEIIQDTALHSWVHAAVAPIRDEKGRIAGVAELSSLLRVTDFGALNPTDAAGYGLVSESGEEIYTVGERIDGVRRQEFAHAIGDSFDVNDVFGHPMIFVARIRASDGAPNGFFYVFLTSELLNESIFRILALVSIIIVLLLILMTAIFIFAIAKVLKPIRDLRLASLQVEGGDYDVHVVYDSPDELGEQARAFNRMSETIRRRTATLEEALREERDFLLSTVKELQTPLNIFRWTLELMRFGDVGALNKSQMELMEQLHQTNMRLYHFVQSLNDAAKLEAGDLTPKPTYFAVVDIIDDVAGISAVDVRRKNITLNWRHPTLPPAKIFADKDHARQILLTLVSNAVKFTKEDGRIEIAVREIADAGDDGRTAKFVQVSVEDNGRGIPKSVQARVFERFFRDEAVRRMGIPGAGLGLYIGKKLVELNGGKVWFISQEGSGSTFFVTFRTSKQE